LTKILEYGEKSVFEDMAYHAASFMNREFVSKFTNKFITRDPKPVISSVNRFGTDFTLETGYEQQHRLFNLAIENGEEPAIVDASNLTEDPEDIVAA
jgi:hypothetical protein